MFAGTGRYTGFRHACIYLISYLSHSVYLERILPGRFSSRPAKRECGIQVRSTGIHMHMVLWRRSLDLHVQETHEIT